VATTIPSSQATTPSLQPTPSPQPTPSSPQPTNLSPPARSKGGLSAGVKAGIAIGGIICVAVAAFFICWSWRRWGPWRRAPQPEVDSQPNTTELEDSRPPPPAEGDSQPNTLELEDSRSPPPPPPPPAEGDSQPITPELEDSHPPPELDGSERPHHDPAFANAEAAPSE
jgi:hypothetical protein